MSAGFYDANGVYQYGESDPIALFSATLNKGMDSVSDAIGLDRIRLTKLELATQPLGNWTIFTPTLNNWVIGNGSVTGRFIKINKTALVKVEVIIGSTTTYTNTSTSIGLPSDAFINYGLTSQTQAPLGTGVIYDASPATTYPATAYFNTTTSFRFNVLNAASTYATSVQVSNTVPITLAANDQLKFLLSYETTT
jgi:hypothetical protein